MQVSTDKTKNDAISSSLAYRYCKGDVFGRLVVGFVFLFWQLMHCNTWHKDFRTSMRLLLQSKEWIKNGNSLAIIFPTH